MDSSKFGKLLPLVDAVEAATGRRPHPRTVLRWALKGINGVRLETVIFGGRRLCSAESVKCFVVATTEAKDGTAK